LAFWILSKDNGSSPKNRILIAKYVYPFEKTLYVVIFALSGIGVAQEFVNSEEILEVGMALSSILIIIYLAFLARLAFKQARKDIYRNENALQVFLTLTCQRGREKEIKKQEQLRIQAEQEHLDSVLANL